MSKDNTNDVSEAGRTLASNRRIVAGTCEICYKRFTGTRKRKFCSHNCAQKAHLANKRTREGTKP